MLPRKKRKPPRVFHVAEIVSLASEAVGSAFPDIWVEGEVSDVRRHNGHAYFSLNDERFASKIKVVMFARNMVRCRAKLENGERVRLRGYLEIYQAKGDFQLNIRTALPAGVGNIAKQFELTKQKLAAEGLFSHDRKRKLPRFPTTVGVVTSAQGAALQDIIRVSQERFPVRIVVSDCTVQGRLAPRSIVMALRRLARMPDIDLVIVGRGGGSVEDLAAFSDERVARELANFPFPTLSAVGHESDTAIIDFVADQSAATPSHAAEMAVPHRDEVLKQLRHQAQRITQLARASVNEARLQLHDQTSRIGDPRIVLNAHERTLNQLTGNLRDNIQEHLAERKSKLLALNSDISKRDPSKKLAEDRLALVSLEAQLSSTMQHRLLEERRQLLELTQTVENYPEPELTSRQGELRRLMTALNAMSPLSVLERGYAIAFDAQQSAVRTVSQVKSGDSLSVRIQDGEISATVDGVTELEA